VAKHKFCISVTEKCFLAAAAAHAMKFAAVNNLIVWFASSSVGWCLMVLSAQQGYIMPCKDQ